MPDLGGKKFVDDFRAMLQKQVAEAFAQGRRHIQEATAELTKEIVEQSKGAAAMIREEARTVREGFAPTTGNNPTEEELAAEAAAAAARKAAANGADGKPDPTHTDSGGGNAS